MAHLLKLGKVWYSDLRMGGHRIRRALSRDRRIAEEKLADLVQLRAAQRHGHGLGDLAWELFRAKYKIYSQTKKKNSAYYDEVSLRALETHFPITKVSQVTPEILEQLKYRLKAGGMSENSINRRLSAVKAAMRKAHEWGFGQEQSWKTVKKFKTTFARVDWFTVKELSALLKGLKGDYRIIAYLASRCGLRLGEIVHLEWTDIDWKLKRINIGAKPGWDPKDYEKRFVPIPEDCLAVLKARSAPTSHATGPILGKHAYQGLSHMLAREIKEIVGHGSCHTLRHTYASHLVQAGVPMYTISKLLGHASIQTTERHYAHLAQSHLDDAAAKLPALNV